MKYTIKNHINIDKVKWQEYVDKHQYGTIFHTPLIFDVYSQTNGYSPFALFVVSDNDEIEAMLLGYIQSVFSINIGNLNKRIVLMNAPIFNSKETLDFLLSYFISNFSGKGLYTEIRNHYMNKDVAPNYSKHNFLFEDHVNLLIDLNQDEDILWKDLSGRRKKEVKHAQKESFEFRHVFPRDYQEFYMILSNIYKKAKTPLVDKSYFQALWEVNSPQIILLGIYDNDILVGAVLLFTYKKTIYSIYGGSKADYYNRRPNDFLFWNVILWAKQNGFETYDWMGAGNPNRPYGVRDWKKQFGGEMVNYGRYHYVPSTLKMKLAETGFKLVQKLKYSK